MEGVDDVDKSASFGLAHPRRSTSSLGDSWAPRVVVLRATQKVLRSLPVSGAANDASTSALGDWYVNRIVIDRQPLLLLLSSKSLLAILEPARNLKELPVRLSALVEGRLRQLPVSSHIISCEITATRDVSVGTTIDRSVVGQMVDFAKALTFYLPENWWGAPDLREAEARFAETPCRCSGADKDVIWPERKAIQLLETTWPSSPRKH